MAMINVSNLTFYYEGSFDNVFEDVSFSIDTEWKLAFIGRNGKGKTTFLNLLQGKYEYKGSINVPVPTDYFPYKISNNMLGMCASEFIGELKPGCEEWRVICELDKLDITAEVLYRPFASLSNGERTKVMLALLFSEENDFLLVDEPTDHLDHDARETVKKYLCQKKGFILVSHDRDLLDACTDHVLVLNRKSIEIQSGNFSSWWENKIKKDNFSRMENKKHLHEISSLEKSVKQCRNWANKNESTKIGYDPIKEHDRSMGTRAYIGAKTKKMQKRVKQYEQRIEKEIKAKEGLLEDIENPVELKINPLVYHKETLVYAKDFTMGYTEGKPLFKDFNFKLERGERVFLHGKNGCGKTSLIKAILSASNKQDYGIISNGQISTGAGIIISYINQDTSFLKGDIKEFCIKKGLDESLFCALLRQLDLERVQFVKPFEDYSEGQKKKVLIASSLMTPAHLYIWDEPLNYIDIFTRMQLEELLLKFNPSMILVEHDIRFQEKIATRVIEM
ncbi:MAG: ABC-F family ATP-binding cassette domain-containing protein [Lachnospiraceae bacterium]|nr:ABC-F family ATP-binding cassette domain-containing protein [Lachnospiraceae bacterium]